MRDVLFRACRIGAAITAVLVVASVVLVLGDSGGATSDSLLPTLRPTGLEIGFSIFYVLFLFAVLTAVAALVLWLNARTREQRAR
jgi:hypothetical protein